MPRRREAYRVRESAVARFGAAVTAMAPAYELRLVGGGGARKGPPVRTPQQSATLLRPLFAERAVESLIALYLDARHHAIGTVEIARGGLNVVHVSPRELLQVALVFGSPATVIAHNHPTGDALPSEDDVALTKRLRAAGALVGVEVIDHLVVGDGAYYSFTSGRLFRDEQTPARAIERNGSQSLPHAQLMLPLDER